VEEEKYPTQRFLRCRKCGRIFVASLSGSNDCPDCASTSLETYTPGSDTSEKSDSAETSTEENAPGDA
jgi:predicted  nucleic acid-binding Zn-ribbon protein